jgi:hypothetical protein
MSERFSMRGLGSRFGREGAAMKTKIGKGREIRRWEMGDGRCGEGGWKHPRA